MEPEDKALERLDDLEELSEPDESAIELDHFDEHMDPFAYDFYKIIDKP